MAIRNTRKAMLSAATYRQFRTVQPGENRNWKQYNFYSSLNIITVIE
jgi:hypothetical protein